MLRPIQQSPAGSSFRWLAFDVAGYLPSGWVEQMETVIRAHMTSAWLTPTHESSRELPTVEQLAIWRVDDTQAVLSELPWMEALYTGILLDCASQYDPETPIQPSNQPYRIGVNVSMGNRGEAHVDQNQVQGLLAVIGNGDLVVSHDPLARGPRQIDQRATLLSPTPGWFYVFQAGNSHPHYAKAGDGLRVNFDCNYYAVAEPGWTEARRSPTLSGHLRGRVR